MLINRFLFLILVSYNAGWIFLGNFIAEYLSGFSGPAVMLLAIGDSSFLSVPEANDVLIVLLSTEGTWGNMAYYVSMTVIGSVIGCMILYSVGRKGGRAILKKRFSGKKIERAEKIYSKHGLTAVLIASILPPPLPFKIFVISAGVFGLSPLRFFSAVAVGRSVRYTMWGILAVLYGETIKVFLQNNLRTVGFVLFFAVILIFIGTFFFYRRRKKNTGEVVSQAIERDAR